MPGQQLRLLTRPLPPNYRCHEKSAKAQDVFGAFSYPRFHDNRHHAAAAAASPPAFVRVDSGARRAAKIGEGVVQSVLGILQIHGTMGAPSFVAITFVQGIMRCGEVARGVTTFVGRGDEGDKGE